MTDTQLLVIIGVIYLSQDMPPSARIILGSGAILYACIIGLMR
jgi:hypothetical protein